MSISQFLQTHLNQNPAAIAVKDATTELTYQQLNRESNRLANYLRQQGVAPEVLVGIYAERSVDMAISILGVLKAGGAYIPLDPAYPKERLGSILAETQLQLILTQSHLAADFDDLGASLKENRELDLFLLDTQWDKLATVSEELVPAQTTPDNLAYVMYTSGSTGKPQGVQITLGQVECYLSAVNEVGKIQPEDVYLLSASFSFSSSIRQLLLPLSQGAKVVITSKENTSNLRSLIELIHTENITVFDTVASVWNYLLVSLAQMEQVRGSQLTDSKIRLLIFSGGLLTSQLLNRVRSQFPQPPQIVNIYGQTETIGVCAYPVPDDFNQEDGYAPVGSPYPHNQLYVLNDELEPVGVSQTGELYVAGESLARGYLNNPQLNDLKFISNPFTTDDRQRLYKTGDLARYLPDGNLEIVGRQDFQVKIRGMRVEIEEIETVLTQHPDVQQAAVVGKENRSGEQIIVAYIVPNCTQINISDVRSYLKTKLTDYMMPSAFEILDALPLTPNNKLDRKRLPEPSRENFTVVQPNDELELQLVKIWEKVLDVQPIGISDNFFDLGGHSLLALYLFAQIEQVWGKHLSWAILLRASTIAELADVIRQEEHSDTWSPLVLLGMGDEHKSPLFCIHPVGGTLFCYYDLVKKMGEERPIYGLQAQGLDGKQQPLDRIEDMASCFIKSIQTVQQHGPYLLLGYSLGGVIAFEIARQLADLGQEIAFLGLLDIESPNLKQDKSLVLQKIKFHLDKFQNLELKEQLKYFPDMLLRKLLRKEVEYKDLVATTISSSPFLEQFTPELSSVLASSLQARKDYQPQVYPGNATVFWSEYQDIYISQYPKLGWEKLISGAIETQFLPGDHLSLMKEPHVQVVAETLCSHIANTERCE
jgi:amino acid adenylation domain-containing protein